MTGGLDRSLRLWLYDEGACTHVGVGHSGAIARARISPDGARVVTVGAEGAIMVWTMPPAGPAGGPASP